MQKQQTKRDIEVHKFIELTILIKQWFKAEEIEVSDFVVGRMALRIQDLIEISLIKNHE